MPNGGLRVALQLLKAEGLPNVFLRHTRNALAMQAGLMAMGLELLVENEAERSPAVTAVKLPGGIAYKALAQGTEQLGLTIGGGLQRLEGKIFRVGHLGMLHEMEVIAILGALEMVLYELGHPLQLGTATGAAMASYLLHLDRGRTLGTVKHLHPKARKLTCSQGRILATKR